MTKAQEKKDVVSNRDEQRWKSKQKLNFSSIATSNSVVEGAKIAMLGKMERREREREREEIIRGNAA